MHGRKDARRQGREVQEDGTFASEQGVGLAGCLLVRSPRRARSEAPHLHACSSAVSLRSCNAGEWDVHRTRVALIRRCMRNRQTTMTTLPGAAETHRRVKRHGTQEPWAQTPSRPAKRARGAATRKHVLRLVRSFSHANKRRPLPRASAGRATEESCFCLEVRGVSVRPSTSHACSSAQACPTIPVPVRRSRVSFQRRESLLVT